MPLLYLIQRETNRLTDKQKEEKEKEKENRETERVRDIWIEERVRGARVGRVIVQNPYNTFNPSKAQIYGRTGTQEFGHAGTSQFEHTVPKYDFTNFLTD